MAVVATTSVVVAAVSAAVAAAVAAAAPVAGPLTVGATSFPARERRGMHHSFAGSGSSSWRRHDSVAVAVAVARWFSDGLRISQDGPRWLQKAPRWP